MSIWNEMYNSAKMPSYKEINNFVATPFLSNLCQFIETKYNVEPSIEHSTCSMQPGWNIKYKKSSKSICTIYPEEGYFTCMITITGKMMEQFEFMLPSCDKSVQEVYKRTSLFNGTKWLMIDVNNNSILDDIKEIIDLKLSIK